MPPGALTEKYILLLRVLQKNEFSLNHFSSGSFHSQTFWFKMWLTWCRLLYKVGTRKCSGCWSEINVGKLIKHPLITQIYFNSHILHRLILFPDPFSIKSPVCTANTSVLSNVFSLPFFSQYKGVACHALWCFSWVLFVRLWGAIIWKDQVNHKVCQF